MASGSSARGDLRRSALDCSSRAVCQRARNCVGSTYGRQLNRGETGESRAPSWCAVVRVLRGGKQRGNAFGETDHNDEHGPAGFQTDVCSTNLDHDWRVSQVCLWRFCGNAAPQLRFSLRPQPLPRLLPCGPGCLPPLTVEYRMRHQLMLLLPTAPAPVPLAHSPIFG